MHRLFVAIELPPDIKQKLVALQAGLPGARWAAPETLHVTLRFIGEVDRPQAEDIAKSLDTVGGSALQLRLGEAGLFPLRGKPRVVWVGVRANETLAALKSKIDRALRSAGCGPDERRFTPHVTLARLRDVARAQAARYVGEIAPSVTGSITAAGFVLFESHLASSGAIHRPVNRYPLTDR